MAYQDGSFLQRFNPRPSCEGRPKPSSPRLSMPSFQSTPLMRGATRRRQGAGHGRAVSIHAPHARGDARRDGCTAPSPCFNPRPSCEGRLRAKMCSYPRPRFQSTPLMRGATRSQAYPHAEHPFQSTPLMRGATDQGEAHVGNRTVSIHAPHARGD